MINKRLKSYRISNVLKTYNTSMVPKGSMTPIELKLAKESMLTNLNTLRESINYGIDDTINFTIKCDIFSIIKHNVNFKIDYSIKTQYVWLRN